MFHFVKLICLLVVTTQIEAICRHNSKCWKTRDTIEHYTNSVQNIEKIWRQPRWWLIQPINGKKNILMAFKNFRSTANTVTIQTIKQNGQQTVKVFGGTLNNFELLEKNVWTIIVNVTITEETNTNFTLDYYSDCEVTAETQVEYPYLDQNGHNPSKCVIIMPQGQIRRIYFALKNIYLPYEVQLTIKDIHTSAIIETIEGAVEYKATAVQQSTNDEQNSNYVMLDLACLGQVCDFTKAHYLLSYYVMDDADVLCMEVQNLCINNNNILTRIPQDWCNLQCSALDDMLEQEYLTQTKQSTTRSGSVNTPTKSTISSRRRRRCPVPGQCQCKKSVARQYNFCEDKRNCTVFKGCTMKCILDRIRCTKIRTLIKTTMTTLL